MIRQKRFLNFNYIDENGLACKRQAAATVQYTFNTREPWYSIEVVELPKFISGCTDVSVIHPEEGHEKI